MPSDYSQSDTMTVCGVVPREVGLYILAYARARGTSVSAVACDILADWTEHKQAADPVSVAAHQMAAVEEKAGFPNTTPGQKTQRAYKRQKRPNAQGSARRSPPRKAS